MGCGASRKTAPTTDDTTHLDRPFRAFAPVDPVELAKGSWFDPTGATAYDKCFVKLTCADDRALMHAHVVVEIVGNSCFDAGKFEFGRHNCSHICMLLSKRSSGSRHIKIACNGGDTQTLAMPVQHDVWTECGTIIPNQSFSEAFGDVFAAASHDGSMETRRASRRAEPKHPAAITVHMLTENWEKKLATAEQLAGCRLEYHTIVLNDAEPGEKAVVSFRTRKENTRMFVWLPGRNDTFSHPHVVGALLDLGYDLFVFEHRRQGRALLGCSAEDFALASHVDDFRKYLDEHDKSFAFALSRKRYNKVVLYGHSTGGLEASVYLREGAYRERIDAVVLNSPFLNWGGVSSVEFMLLHAMEDLYAVMKVFVGQHSPLVELSKPSGPSWYGTGIWCQYPAVNLCCRNMFTNIVTAGWASASSHMHEELKKMTPIDVPLLLLYTDGDLVLNHSEMPKLASHISSNVIAKYVPGCRHDMLLSYFHDDNMKVLNHILKFLTDTCGTQDAGALKVQSSVEQPEFATICVPQP
jgi:alpha-beta hydrolase superfamily lysophospholipase